MQFEECEALCKSDNPRNSSAHALSELLGKVMIVADVFESLAIFTIYAAQFICVFIENRSGQCKKIRDVLNLYESLYAMESRPFIQTISSMPHLHISHWQVWCESTGLKS